MSNIEPPTGPPSSGDGMTPPPPPAGGSVPPPPPPPGAPGAAGPQWSVGDALNYGWAKFQANAGQIIIAGVVLVVGIVIFEVVGFGIRSLLVTDPECFTNDNGFITCDAGSGFIISLLASAIMSFFFFLVAQVIGAGIIRGALDITEGRAFEISTVFKTDKIGPVVITSLMTSAIVFVGLILCYLPGLIAAFFLQFALFFVVDKNLEPIEAIKASFNLVKDNAGNVIVWYIVGGLVAVAGFVACLVGAIVTIPIVIIGSAYTYKKLTGQAVAA